MISHGVRQGGAIRGILGVENRKLLLAKERRSRRKGRQATNPMVLILPLVSGLRKRRGLAEALRAWGKIDVHGGRRKAQAKRLGARLKALHGGELVPR
jgi:hypothetical protein